MTFEEIESAWALQQPAKTAAIDLATLKAALKAQLDHRRRLLLLAGASLILTLVIMQVLFFANLRVMRQEDQWLFFTHLMLHQGLNLGLVLELIRIFLRHRQMARGRAESVRDVVVLSLARVEAEMADYRLGCWAILAWTMLALTSAYFNQPGTRVGWEAFGVRAGLITAVYGLIGLLAWRQFRLKFQPERERLKTTLAQLEKNEK